MSGATGFAAVAVGGALGACSRYSVSLLFAGSGARFPYGTLVANLSGALLAGFLVAFMLSRGLVSTPVYFLLVTGFLGSFTTLSAFSVETMRLVHDGDIVPAIVNVLITVGGALIAVLAGGWLARQF